MIRIQIRHNIHVIYLLYYLIQVDSAIFFHRLYFGEILRHLPPLGKILVTPLGINRPQGPFFAQNRQNNGEVHCKTIFQRVKEDVQGIIKQFLFFLETPPTLRKEPSKFRSCTPFSQFVRGYGRRLLVDCDGNGRTFLVVCYGMEELCSQFVTEMEGLDSQFVKERQNLLFYERFSFFPSQTTSKVLPLHS